MDLIQKIQRQVESVKGVPFLAPYTRNNKIKVRISKLVLELDPITLVTHLKRPVLGWWVTDDCKTAEYQKAASDEEIRNYFSLFPTQVRFLITDTKVKKYRGIAAREGTGKVQIDGEVPVWILDTASENIPIFSETIAIFDGQNFWHHRVVEENYHDLVVTSLLRHKLEETSGIAHVYHRNDGMALPLEVRESIKHSRPEHKKAYEIALHRKIVSQVDVDEKILKQALIHAGAKLKRYVKEEDTYRITIEVDGQEQRPVVVTHDMQMITAGVCLAGEDQLFDLQSLVGVLREGGYA